MKIETTRFGSLEVPESEVVTFPSGLVGFGDVHQYVFIDHPGGGPFRWMQAVQVPNLAFVVCDPLLFKPDYEVKVHQDELASIEIEDIADGAVVVILVVRKDPRQMTANLQGPIVVNLRRRLAKQLILSGPEYTTRYAIFQGE
ncbi:MAG: flagellar assembly protein FliW, partial [Planctomycetes bacterium]|nr:flagellar assembly protein FliW [Planctomycetota bacterium]